MIRSAAAAPAAAPALPTLGEVLDFLRLVWAVDHSLQRASRRMKSALGVTGPQRLVLRIAGKYPGITAGQIAALLHLHPSTVTDVLERLERGRLVGRREDPRDRRRVLIGLTRRGREIDVRDEGTIEAAVERALRSFSHPEIQAARTVLARLAAALLERPSVPSAAATSPARGQKPPKAAY